MGVERLPPQHPACTYKHHYQRVVRARPKKIKEKGKQNQRSFGRLAVGILDPLGRGEYTEQYPPCGICWF
jgi:hypothetical protein